MTSQQTPSIDAKKLKEAIEHYRNVYEEMLPDHREKARLLLDAAEAHLATLPKTKRVWRVNGCARNVAPYERDYTAHDTDELNSYIACLHADGFGRVTIITVEVPE